MIRYSEELDYKTLNYLRRSVGWREFSDDQANLAISNSICNIIVFNGQEPIAMGRLIGDLAIYFSIVDVVVHPDFQGQGVGKEIITRLVNYVEQHMESNSLKKISINIISEPGKEEFYEKLGFINIQREVSGTGMQKIIAL